jgi:predicted transposase YbfD/YdcC
MISAWAANQGITLGQIKTEEKSNEIEAIPSLLNMIDVSGSIVTIDAMGCQKKIAKKIVNQNADYVLALKQNQGSLYNDVVSIFERGKEVQFKKMLNRRIVEKVHDHGRVETRRYTLISARDPLLFKLRWPGFNGIGILKVIRTVNNRPSAKARNGLKYL